MIRKRVVRPNCRESSPYNGHKRTPVPKIKKGVAEMSKIDKPGKKCRIKGLPALVRELERVKNQAKALGIFTNDRELIECPSCGLLEDVTFEGLLVTYQKDSKVPMDSGLRFIQADNTHFECPKCGARVKAQIL
jgi:predicted RNA-binding Zn-ribbon protein involved in translation (DUF1610 family)